jgi:hypothetical protein
MDVLGVEVGMHAAKGAPKIHTNATLNFHFCMDFIIRSPRAKMGDRPDSFAKFSIQNIQMEDNTISPPFCMQLVTKAKDALHIHFGQELAHTLSQ